MKGMWACMIYPSTLTSKAKLPLTLTCRRSSPCLPCLKRVFSSPTPSPASGASAHGSICVRYTVPARSPPTAAFAGGWGGDVVPKGKGAGKGRGERYL